MTLRSISVYAFPLFFIAAGLLHMFKTGFYASKLPAFVPYKNALVILAGVFEMLLAVCAVFPATRRFASLAVMAFLMLVVPINILHLLRASPSSSSALLWVRVLFLSALASWAFVNSRF